MLLKECMILERLTHPHISRYFLNFYSKNNMYFNIVMELIEGGTLEDKIPGTPPPAEVEIINWTKQMASALCYMHGEGVLHRDLKPDNVMLTKKSKVKIIDLGLASVAATDAFHSKTGSDMYASYEKLTPGIPYDNRDDMWAMGCILLELLLQTRLTEPISHPHNKQVAARRSSLLAAAAAVSPEIGGYVLPHLLCPQQEGRWNAEQLVEALSSLRMTSRPQVLFSSASAKLPRSETSAPPMERSTVSMRLPVSSTAPTTTGSGTSGRSRAQTCVSVGGAASKPAATTSDQPAPGRESPTPPPRPPRPAHLSSSSSSSAGSPLARPVSSPTPIYPALAAPSTSAAVTPPLRPARPPRTVSPVPASAAGVGKAADVTPIGKAEGGLISSLVQQLHGKGTEEAKEQAVRDLRDLVIASETHRQQLLQATAAMEPLRDLQLHGTAMAKAFATEVLEALHYQQLDAAEILSQTHSGRQELVEKSLPALVLLLKFGPKRVQEQAVDALGTHVLDEKVQKLIAVAGAIPPLVQLLRDGPESVKEETAWVLRNLALDTHHKKIFKDADAIPPLVALLQAGREGARYQAAAALRNLAVDVETRKAIAAAGAIAPLVQLLGEGAEDASVQAAGALASLAEVAANVKTIAVAGAIPLLVQLLKDGTCYAQEQAAAALMSLGADHVSNVKIIAGSGVIPLLVRLLQEGTEVGKEKAAGALRNLSVDAENKKLIAKEGAIGLLVQLLRVGSAEGKLVAAGALRNLAVDAENKKAIAAEGAIPLLVLLLSEGSDHAKGTAVVALHNLVESCGENLALLRAASAVGPLRALKQSGIYGVSFANKLLVLLAC